MQEHSPCSLQIHEMLSFIASVVFGITCVTRSHQSGLEHLTGFSAFPISSLLERPVEFYGPGTRAVVDASAAIPAFLGMQDDRALTLFRIGDENIRRAAVDTNIASVAYFRIEDSGSAWRRYIGNGVHFHNILRLGIGRCKTACCGRIRAFKLLQHIRYNAGKI